MYMYLASATAIMDDTVKSLDENQHCDVFTDMSKAFDTDTIFYQISCLLVVLIFLFITGLNHISL